MQGSSKWVLRWAPCYFILKTPLIELATCRKEKKIWIWRKSKFATQHTNNRINQCSGRTCLAQCISIDQLSGKEGALNGVKCECVVCPTMNRGKEGCLLVPLAKVPRCHLTSTPYSCLFPPFLAVVLFTVHLLNDQLSTKRGYVMV